MAATPPPPPVSLGMRGVDSFRLTSSSGHSQVSASTISQYGKANKVIHKDLDDELVKIHHSSFIIMFNGLNFVNSFIGGF